MKKIVLAFCCFITIYSSMAQVNIDYYKLGDSLYTIRDYKNSALAYERGVKQEGKAPIGRYWACACSWSLAEMPDNAFHVLAIIAASDKLNVSDAIAIENDNDFKPIKSDKRWQLFIDSIHNKIFSGIKKLSADVREGRRINPTIDKYNMALAWAVLNKADSSFYYLNGIVKSDYNHLIAYDQLLNERALQSLHNDARWHSLTDEVKKNEVPFTCAHTSRPPGLPMMFTIDPASKSLKGDQKGPYHDNEDKIFSQSNVAYNLLISGVNELEDSGNWSDSSSRYLLIDLNSPVEKSGATKQGIIKDHFAAFHAFYKIDTSGAVDLIYNFRDIPMGSTIESPRTEMMIHINGKLHLLKFGFWSLGDCGEPYSHGGKLNGRETTSVKVTRHSLTSYTIEAPQGSIGRLWNIENRTAPVDRGLFDIAFIVHVEAQ
jgi:hypothetical protein